MRRFATFPSAILAATVLALACGARDTAGAPATSGAGAASATSATAAAPSGAPTALYRDAAATAPAPEAEVPATATLAPLIERLKPAVVNISTTTLTKIPQHRRFGTRQRSPQGDQGFDDFFERFFGRPGPEAPPPEMRGQSLGSGFILNRRGYVLTNNHVVENATDIRVRTADNREFTAKIVGRDPLTDVALIQLNNAPADLPTVVLGNSDALRQGDFVLALGSPLGLRDTATFGIVSAKHRGLNMGATGTYDDYIQTDAAINPGNSGGPLFNLRGEVIGINTAIVSPQIGQGIGFAVPINLAKSLLPQLEHGKVVRGFVGVSLQPELTPDLVEAFGLPPGSKGALVQNVVPDGPAAKAGLKPGDFIVAMDGKPVETSGDLTRAVALVPPGQKVTLTVLRGGQKRDFTFPVATRPGEKELAAGGGGQEEQPEGKQPKLGVTLAPLTPDVASKLGIHAEKGVVITDVVEDGPADRAGIRPGDVILEVDRQPVANPAQVKAIVDKMKDGQMALLRVQRGDSAVFVAVPVGGRK